MNQLHQRIIDISYKYNLSHIGSNLTAVDIIDKIYSEKKEYEPFILSSGHAGLALYVVLEKYKNKNAEELFMKYGVHPERNIEDGIYCSSGSLGHGIGIAVGMAIVDKSRKVHVLLSDGECAEGSVYEACNVIREYKIYNINIHINFNGWGAYRKIEAKHLLPITNIVENVSDVKIHKTHSPSLPFLSGLQSHYHVLSENQYKLLKTYEA